MIRDGARIEDGAVLAPNTVVPSHCIFGGSPARCIGTLPESFADTHELESRAYFYSFCPPR